MLYEPFLLGEHYYSVFRSYYRQRTVTAVRKTSRILHTYCVERLPMVSMLVRLLLPLAQGNLTLT
jgi:hypothetical protein